MPEFAYQFAWDDEKAAANHTKHGVDFDLAATVFRDELALTIVDAMPIPKSATSGASTSP